jgi:hypothetical protein
MAHWGLSHQKQTKEHSITNAIMSKRERGHNEFNAVNVQRSERTSLVPCTYVSCLLKYYLHYGNLQRVNWSVFIRMSPLR